jgi:hypothetical protein
MKQKKKKIQNLFLVFNEATRVVNTVPEYRVPGTLAEKPHHFQYLKGIIQTKGAVVL